MRLRRHAMTRADRRRPRPAHGASARGRRGTRTAHVFSPNRRTALAFILGGAWGPVAKPPRPPRASEDEPGEEAEAGGPAAGRRWKPTKSRRCRSRSQAARVLQLAPWPSPPRRGEGWPRRSSLPAAGRHSMRPARHEARSRTSSSTAPRAWSVGPRPTRDEDGPVAPTQPPPARVDGAGGGEWMRGWIGSRRVRSDVPLRHPWSGAASGP
jgi:hypothetical protein